jgi:hypothetical protein
MKHLSSIRKPNFFILGAAKSGTTTLHDYLSQHPDIFMSKVKEPTFFSETFQVIKDPISYYELFDQVENEKLIGESSHAYLSNPKSTRVIHGLFPDAKFILLLRDPIDRANSLFHHMRREGFERISSFDKAIVTEKIRIQSDQFRKKHRQYFYNYMYVNSGKYGEQIARYFQFYRQEQFLILKSQDLFKQHEDCLRRICEFLEISPITSIHPSAQNIGRAVKSSFLAQLLQSPPFISRPLKNSLLQRGLSYLNNSTIPLVDETIRKKLQQELKEDQNLLEQLTGIRFF